MKTGWVIKLADTIRSAAPSHKAAAAEVTPAEPQPHLNFSQGVPCPPEVVEQLRSEAMHYRTPIDPLLARVTPGTPEFYAILDGEAGSYMHTRDVREKEKGHKNQNSPPQ